MTSENSTPSPSGKDAAAAPAASKPTAAVPPEQRYGKWRIVAAVAGLLGFVLAILTPFLPVKETTASVNWPQNGKVANVDAPLVSYVPIRLDVTLPCSLVGALPLRAGRCCARSPVTVRVPACRAW
ncbi:Cell wall arabinan synthesis protein OS=Tsukamurella paurometabola (strain ATCC 8368 / DSM /CCUG 35730 / CIP 100753 / JCM 10117 / KCTC 9821 / NBRC 16120/ NCIMB 702349 / NCTC 13040) OX=521096 GN=Tpau_4139 PE=3 SV=1 [Tsukamurella paurometabola]